MTAHSVRDEFFHADGQTDGCVDRHDEADLRFFRNITNDPKNITKILDLIFDHSPLVLIVCKSHGTEP